MEKEISLGSFRGREMVLKVPSDDSFEYRQAWDVYIDNLMDLKKRRAEALVDQEMLKFVNRKKT